MSRVNYVKGSFAEPVSTFRRTLNSSFLAFGRDVGDHFVEEVEERTPGSKTNRLKRSIRRSPVRRVSPQIIRGTVYSNEEHASFVEEDTRPHKIPVVRTDEGRFVPTDDPDKMIEHPGTTGVHMFARGAEATDRWLDVAAERWMKFRLREAGLRVK